MKDTELRGIILQMFYDNRKGPKRNWFPADFQHLPWPEVVRICYHLREEGLITGKGQREGIVGNLWSGEISAKGVNAIEATAQPPHVPSISITNSSHVQIGNGNVQDVKLGSSRDDKNSPQLDAIEEEILRESAESGDVLKLTVSMYGCWIRAGKTDFFWKDDLAKQAIYLDGFESLCSKGFIRHEGGHLYKLTGRGFSVARGLLSASNG